MYEAINRTILELKQINNASEIVIQSAINRTILELKLPFSKRRRSKSMLLIEPFWNWNVATDYEDPAALDLLIEPFWNWNTFHDAPFIKKIYY